MKPNHLRFRISLPGKWILSGEHSVLRGYPAVALPHAEYNLLLEYEEAEGGTLRAEPNTFTPVLQSLVSQLTARWDYLKKPDARPPQGTLKLQSSIPVGAGFGSSAAVCYAISAWYSTLYQFESPPIFEMATRLEDHFHGKSSGLDVAVVSSGRPLLYQRGQSPEILSLKRLPRFSFHDTGVRANTQACIAKVERFMSREPEAATRWDERMGNCSSGLASLLQQYADEDEGARGSQSSLIYQIADHMNIAQECFAAWDLVPSHVALMERNLRESGALGVKLTGAGGGGFLVALWPE